MNGILFAMSVVLFLASLPGTIELALLTFPALLPRRSLPGAESSVGDIRLAVAIPAHDEEKGLPETLESLLACDNPLPPSDLHVIADNCGDNTAGVARGYGCHVMERQDDALRGKGHALNHAFRHLLPKGYDACIVVDADTIVERNFLDTFRRLFASGASAGQCTYRVRNADENLRTRLMNIAFLAFNFLRPLSRHNLGLSAGILGNGFALSRETLAEVPYNSFSIVEDLEYHSRLIAAGRRVHFLHETAVWSDMPATSQEARSQRERWEGGRFRMIVERAPALLVDALRTGRPRLLEPMLELLLLPLTFHILLVGALLLVSRGWLFTYASMAFLMIILHVLITLIAGKASREDWKALISAPFYMLWKVVNLSGILKAAGKGVAWKRTSRKDP